MTKILIGADPEFFVKQGGKFISAFGLVNGTKEAPHIVQKGAVQVDGMALEFNIEPAATWKEWRDNLNAVLGQLRDMVPSNHEFHFVPVAEFGKEYIDAQPEDAKKLGCTPDYNAYTGEQNPTPNAEFPFRTASGHVHIGWTEDEDPYDPEHFEACRQLVKQLDVYLGLTSLIWDQDKTRRELYGKAGAFRPKSYGVEYRTISNVWLADEESRRLVYALTRHAVEELMKGKRLYELFQEAELQRIINESDVKAAYKFLYWTGLNGFDLENWFWQKAKTIINELKATSNRDELGRWRKINKVAKPIKAMTTGKLLSAILTDTEIF